MDSQPVIKILEDEYERATQCRDSWRGKNDPIAAEMASYYQGKMDATSMALALLKN